MKKILFSILILTVPLFAKKMIDVVQTRDQNLYKGHITTEDTAAIYIELEGGSIIRVLRSNILKIEHSVNATIQEEGFQRHDGFYLSMCLGTVQGKSELKGNFGASTSAITVSGTSMGMNFKIGGAVSENLILSFDTWQRSFILPEVEIDGSSVPSDSTEAGDVSMGLGVTQYFMPYNAFVSGSLGIARFILNEGMSLEPVSEFGLSVIIKVGKEWWVSKNWGLGISGGYAFANADDKKSTLNPAYTGKFSTNEFFVLFNTTFN